MFLTGLKKNLNNQKKCKLLAFSAIFIYLILLSPAWAMSDVRTGLDQSASVGFLGEQLDEIDEDEDRILINLPGALGRIIGAILSLLGVIFLLLMIYGGMIWMTARGNESKVKEAKDLITAAIVGLIIVLAAYAITAFIGAQLTTGR